MNNRARVQAERLRTEVFRSFFNDGKQVVTQEVTAIAPLMGNEDEEQQETTAVDTIMTEENEQSSIRLSILIKPEWLVLLDELICMNIAVDREGAVEALLRIGSEANRELILAHAELRKKLQE